MINFIICDNNPLFIKKAEEIIMRVMINNDIKYKIHKFVNYDASFMKIMKKKGSFKVYILDIEVNGKSGIEIAKGIREEDIDSVLIFCTAYYEKYEKDILKSKFLFLDFIDKRSDYQKELEETVSIALKRLFMNNIVRFKSQNIVYTIATKDILYVMRTKDRKCTIQMTDNSIVVSKTLIAMKKMLGNRFIYAHRACIVNYDRIIQYNQKDRTILFDNHMGIDLVSSMFRDEMNKL